MEPLGRMSSHSQYGWLPLARGKMFVENQQWAAIVLLQHRRPFVGRWNGSRFRLSDPAQPSAAADSVGGGTEPSST